MKGGVASIHESIEITTAPSGDHLDAHLERHRHLLEGVQRHSADLASLDLRHHPSRDTGSCADVLLPPAAPDSHVPEGGPDSWIAHRDRMGETAYRELLRAIA
jgi:hypothetical protein